MDRDVAMEIVRLVRDEVEVGPDLSDLGPDTPLFDGGLGLDSFAVVELITSIERRFGIQFSDADFHPDNFVDLRALGGVVARYLDHPLNATGAV